MAVVLEPAQIASLFAQSTPACAFALLEASLNECPDAERLRLRGLVLDVLNARMTNEIPLTCDWLKAVFEASAAYLRAGQGGAACDDGTSLADRLCRLVSAALALVSQQERIALFRAVLPELSDVSLACLLLRSSADDQAAEALFGPAVAELRSILQPCVETLGARGMLWQQAAPAPVLWFWWSFAQEDRLYAFVKASMRDSRSLAALLDMIVEPAMPNSRDADLVSVRRWSKIIDFQSLEKEALQLALTGASREDRRRARRFLDAFGNGKSELFR